MAGTKQAEKQATKMADMSKRHMLSWPPEEDDADSDA